MFIRPINGIKSRALDVIQELFDEDLSDKQLICRLASNLPVYLQVQRSSQRAIKFTYFVDKHVTFF